jgi:hypothetical protein
VASSLRFSQEGQVKRLLMMALVADLEAGHLEGAAVGLNPGSERATDSPRGRSSPECPSSRPSYRDWMFSMFIGFALDQALTNLGLAGEGSVPSPAGRAQG